MLTDKFLKANRKVQTAFIKHIQDELTSLELRTSLDMMSQAGDQMLDPSIPVMPMQQPQQPGVLPQAPGMGMQQPGQIPMDMGQGMPPAGSLPAAPMQQPTLNSVMGGTGLMNAQQPVMPPAGSPTALPAL